MTKSERMIKVLGLIYENPGEFDALALARRCDVSERGIFRDIRTLRGVGVHIKYKHKDGEHSEHSGYRIEDVPTYLRRSLKRALLIEAVIELVTLGIDASEDLGLKEKGSTVLKLLGAS